jgi:hypothetical protein
MRCLIGFLMLAGIILGCGDKDPVSSQGAARGLVGYWPMNDTTGDTAIDISGFGNHVGNSLVPLVWNPDGRIGGAVDFNGNTSYLERADSVLSSNFPGKDGSVTGALSVTAWILPRSHSYQMIVAKDQENRRSFNFAITGEGKLSVQIGTGDEMYPFTGDSIIVEGVWSHVAMVYTFVTDTSSIITTYVNGVFDKSISDVNGPVNSTDTPFRIGARSYTGQRRSFNGLLDEVRIYNRALSIMEIQAIMQI